MARMAADGQMVAEMVAAAFVRHMVVNIFRNIGMER